MIKEQNSTAKSTEIANNDNKNNNQDDDMDIDDDLEDIDKQTLNEIHEVTKQYEQDPNSLEVGIKLAKIYIKLNKIENLRTLMNNLHELYTLPEGIWEDWIQEEILNAKTNEQKQNILKLFQKALEDLLYFEVAKLYAKYAEKLYKENILKRNQIKIILEKLIAQFAYDFTRGSKFIKKLRKFEMNYPDEKLKKEDQIKLIRNLFVRQLKIPIADIDLTWEEYTKWEKDQNELKKNEQVYTETFKRVENYLNLEDKFIELIETSNIEGLQNFMNEICQMKDLPFDKITNFYERILEKLNIREEIWDSYINFLAANLKITSQLGKIYQRAVKNCFWNMNFSLKYLRNLELQGEDIKIIEEKIQNTLRNLSGNKENLYVIWLYRCEAYTRIINKKLKENKGEYPIDDIKNFRQKLQEAIDFFNDNSEENQQYLENLYCYWSNVETYTLKSKEDMNRLMEKYIHIHGSKYNSWIVYITLEIAIGTISSTRSLIRRACEYTKDNIYAIYNYALEFERKFGDLEELMKLEQKMKEKIEQINAQINQEIQLEVFEDKQPNNDIKKRKYEEMKAEDEISSDLTEPQTIKKVKKDHGEEPIQPKKIFLDKRNTVYVKNFPFVLNELDLKCLFMNSEKILECRIVRDKLGKSKGYAYIDFESQADAEEAIKLNDTVIDGKKLYVALSAPPNKGKTDENTIFLNNLPFTVTEDMIREGFKPWVDKIKHIRLICDDTGRPRGYGYVEFIDNESFKDALEKNKKMNMEGRRVIISSADSLQKQEKYIQAINVIFMKNLPYDIKEENIQAFFKGYSIKQIYIVTDQHTGKPKGFAYVEFNNHDDTKNALSLHNSVLGGRVIEIVKSERDITLPKTIITEKLRNSLSKKDAISIEPENQTSLKNRYFVKGKNQDIMDKNPQKEDNNTKMQVEKIAVKSSGVNVENKEKPQQKTNDYFKNLFAKK